LGRIKKGKDAMRRIPVLLCSLSLLSAAIGCECLNHTAGVCDCQNDPRGCERYSMHTPYAGCASAAVPATIVAPVPATTTPAPEAPKLTPIPR
jgi:hypothetical protein